MRWDEVDVVVPKGDKLELLFRKQRFLMEKYGIKVLDINTKEGQNVIRATIMHLIEELGEITHCLKNKPWVNYETLVDKNAMYDEVADSLHFFLEIMLLLGINSNSLTELYLKKNKINLERIKSGY